MGMGYFYSDVSDDLINLVSAAGLQDLQGGEFYYNAEVTPWLHVKITIRIKAWMNYVPI